MTFYALALLQQQSTEPMWFVRAITFLQANALGAFMVLLSLATGAFIVQWMLWAFGFGRFDPDKKSGEPAEDVRVIFSDALVKIINDFRHLLALIIVGIFALAVIWALLVSGQNADTLSKSLQAVVSTLGGLVGGIIGYYFGESSARPSDLGGAITGRPETEEQSDPADAAADSSAGGVVELAPQPPELDPNTPPEDD